MTRRKNKPSKRPRIDVPPLPVECRCACHDAGTPRDACTFWDTALDGTLIACSACRAAEPQAASSDAELDAAAERIARAVGPHAMGDGLRPGDFAAFESALRVTYPGAGINGADLVIVDDPPKQSGAYAEYQKDGAAVLAELQGFAAHVMAQPGGTHLVNVGGTVMQYKNGTVSDDQPQGYRDPAQIAQRERRALRVYVAGASADIPRARKAIALLGGVEPRGLVTHDWTEVIAKSRVTDNDMSKAQCERAALDDLRGVAAADVLWLLLPTVPTTGAWFEAGAAWAQDKRIIVSGRRVGIFWALGEHFATDAQAAAAILESASERMAAL